MTFDDFMDSVINEIISLNLATRRMIKNKTFSEKYLKIMLEASSKIRAKCIQEYTKVTNDK